MWLLLWELDYSLVNLTGSCVWLWLGMALSMLHTVLFAGHYSGCCHTPSTKKTHKKTPTIAKKKKKELNNQSGPNLSLTQADFINTIHWLLATLVGERVRVMMGQHNRLFQTFEA